MKILDANCVINLMERLTSFDCAPYLLRYDTIVTAVVKKELDCPHPFKELPFDIHHPSEEEQSICEDLSSYISGLGKGEISVISLALSLSNNHSCDGKDLIVIFSDDREARHIFGRRVCKDPRIRKKYPNVDRIVWSGTAELLKKMRNEDAIGDSSVAGIERELTPILGKRLDLKRRDRGKVASNHTHPDVPLLPSFPSDSHKMNDIAVSPSI